MDKLLVTVPTCGLGNRLRYMSYCKIIADELKRNLVINWVSKGLDDNVNENSNNVNCSFSDLFENDFTHIQFSDFKEEKKTFFDNNISFFSEGKLSGLLENNNKKEELTDVDYVYFYKIPNNEINKIDDFSDKKIIILSGENNICYKLSDSEISLKKTQFYKSLVPSLPIKEMLEKFVNKYKNHVCIHVRTYNKVYDPLVDVSSFWNTEEQKESVENIIEYYKQISKVNSTNEKILLLSNDENLKKHFKDKYPKNISFFEFNDFSRGKLGMQYSLFEWYIMGNCKIIWGSFNSSFSNEATFLNRINKRFIGDFSKVNLDTIESNSICTFRADTNTHIKNPENTDKIVVIIP